MAADYQKHFGRECDQIQYVAWGYDAVNLLARALVIGGNNSEKVRDALTYGTVRLLTSSHLTHDDLCGLIISRPMIVLSEQFNLPSNIRESFDRKGNNQLRRD